MTPAKKHKLNYLPTCSSRLVEQHSCQVSFKSIEWCRRSWEDKLKCVNILSVKDHNCAKICRTWIISPHALLDFWCNIPDNFHSNLCKGGAPWARTSNLWIPSLTCSLLSYVGRYVEWNSNFYCAVLYSHSTKNWIFRELTVAETKAKYWEKRDMNPNDFIL